MHHSITVPVAVSETDTRWKLLCHGVVVEHGFTADPMRFNLTRSKPWFGVQSPDGMSAEDAAAKVAAITAECARVLTKAREMDALDAIGAFRKAESALASAARDVAEVADTLKRIDEGAKTTVSLIETAGKLAGAVAKAHAAIGAAAALASLG